MPRRLLAPLLSFAVILAAAVAPGTPWLRDALLERLRAPLAAAGWTVAWEASAGNAWRGVTLDGVTVAGPDATATLEHLEVGWFLPGLATGAVPIDVRASGLDADVALPASAGGAPGAPDLRALLDPGALPAAARRLRLRDVAVRDASVAVGGAPYALPDVRLTDLALQDTGARLTATATLVGPDGPDDAGRLTATVASGGGALDVRADRLPATWADPYLPGVRGGSVDASVRYRPADGWSGDAELVGGAWHPPDVPAVAALRDVEATADLEGGLLRVDASGRADAGTVLANADVDLTLRRVAAEVRASGRLEDVLPAAVRDAPAAARPSGTTFVALSVRGWRDLRLDADARLQGTWDGRPATLRADGVTFHPNDGWTGTLDGRLLGGDVALALEGGGVPRIRATLAGARAAGATLAGDADLRSVAPLDAAWSLDVAGVPGGPLDATTASLRGRHDPDGATLEADVDAEALRGTGAWRLARGGVEGGATLRLAGADAAGGDGRIELRTDGPWEALGVAVRTAADAPWRPAWRGVRADADVRGVVRADLRGATLHALDGAWGPLHPARIDGGVRLALAPTPLRVGGTPVGRVGVSALDVTTGGGTWRAAGDVRLTPAGAFPLDAAPLDVAVEATVPSTTPLQPATWRATATSDVGAATWRDGALTATLDGWPLAWAAAGIREPGRTSARVERPAGGPLTASAVWRPDPEARLAPLEAAYAGTGDGGRATFTAGPIAASTTPTATTVRADGDLGTLHPALRGWRADGTLARAAGDGWRGAVRVAPEGRDAVIELDAEGGGLALDAAASVAGARARAAGPVWPTTDVRIETAAAEGAATLEARIGGPDAPLGADLPLDGRAAWTAASWGPYRLAGGDLRIGGRLAAPEVTGPTGRQLRIEDGVAAGGLVLRADVADRPHTVRFRADGPLADPDVRFAVDGDVVTVRADRAPGRADLDVRADVTPAGWPDVLAPVAPGAGRLTGAVGADGGWRIAVRGDVAPLERPAVLEVDGAGVGRDATATWRVATPDGRDLLAGRVAQRAGVTTLALDGTRSDPTAIGRWGGWPLDGRARGEAVLEVRGGRPGAVALRGDARLDGTLGGRPLEVALDAGGGGRATYADTELTWSPDAAALALASPDATLDAVLASPTRAEVSGVVADRDVAGAVAWGDGEARADVRVGTADARLQLATAPGGWTAALRARAAEGTDAAWTIDATADADDDGVALRRFTAAVGAGRATATAEGALWPDLDVRGRARAAALGDAAPVALGVRGAWPRVTGRAALPGLTLDVATRGLAVAGVTLAGPGADVANVRVTPGDAGLAWTPEGGYAGAAQVAFAPDAGTTVRADVRGDANGDGALVATVDARLARAGATLEGASTVRWTGAPWRATVAGDGRLDGALAGEGARLAADLTWAGTSLAPRVAGTGSLRGATDADVTFAAAVGPDGPTVEARADGDALDLVGRAAPDGATLRGTVRDLALPPTWTAGSPLTVDADLDARAGADPGTALGTLRLRGRGLAWDPTWRAGPDADLAGDARIDVGAATNGAASGTLAGPLGVAWPRGAAPRIDASLDVTDVAWRATTGRGTLRVAGPWSAPRVTTDLTLAGAVAGSLAADLDVASGAASWRSDLRDDAGAPWAVGALARPAGAPQVEGALDVPDGAVRGGSVGGAPALLGEGRWADLRVARGGARDGGDGAAPDPRLEVVLPLASLGPGLAGDAAFTVRPTPDASWLEGVVRRPRVAGTALPDATLLGRAGDVEVRIDGRSVLDVRLADGRWRASADALPLVRDGRTASLDVDGEGRGAQGRLRAEVRTPEGDTDVRLDLVRDGDGTRLAAAGPLAGGRLDGVAVRREGRWSGGPTLEALPTPLGPTTARATLRGTGPLPSGALEVTAPATPQADTSGTDASGPDASGPATSARATWTWPTDAAPTGAAPTRTGPAVDVAIDAADAAASGSLWPALDLAVEGPDGRRAHLTGAPNAAWRVEGAAALPLGPLHLQLDGDPAGVPRLAVGLAAAPDATLRTRLPDAPPATAVQRLLRDGLVARGVGTLSGEVAWTPGDPVAVRALTWAADVGTTTLDGAVAPGGSDLRGRFTPARGADATLAARLADEVAGGDALAWRLHGTLDAATLDVGDPADADAALSGRVAWRGVDGVLHADLVGPGVRIDARAVPGDGVRGEATLDGVRVALPGAVTARVDGRLEADGDRVTGRLTATGPGRLQADGGVDVGRWLPDRYRTASAGRPNDVTVRLASFDVARLPVVARTLPYLEGDLAATVRIDGRRVIAQATAPDLRVADDPLPLRLEGIGDVGPGGRGVTLGGALAGSPVQLGLDGAGADLSVRMERFPLTTPLEAWLGALETRSEATGVLRATLPWAAPAEGDVRVATERVRLRRDGVSSVGTLAGHLTRDGATLDATFEGAGRWSLALDVADGALDARFRADDADAAPLLGLAPALARVGAGARGDLTLDARGPLRAPDVDVTTDDLEVFLAGSGYRLSDAHLTARDADLRVAATVTGTQPVGGRLEVTGDARATLVPWRLERAALDVRGDLRVPVIGTIREVDGRVSAGPDGRPTLEARGRVGAPARFEGTLWPFDLRARGEGLRLAAPSVWVADAVGDADVRLRFDERFVLSGAVDVDEARFDLGARAEAAAPPAPSPTDAPAEAGAPPPAGGGGAFAFEAFALRAETVAFDEAFGTGTARVDLTLAGTTRRPTLDGVAEIVRGTLDLSGRTFEVREGALRFDPTRGVYPRITVAADAAFDPRDALAGATAGVRLVEPARGPFTVALAFDAVATGDGPTGFALSLDPTLVSDAVLEVPRPDGRGTVTRPPTDGELAALVTTGRLDPTGAATGANAASSVATTVLDNAVSLLLLDGLQDAFGEALGVDRVRIRTSSVGRALGADADPFGVSLEVGGYLGEGVFASYEVGRFAGTAGEALANRLAVTYDLGPVALDLSTRLAFPGPGEGDPDQRVGAAVRYEVAPGLSVEGSASLGSFESEARFGVTLRW